MTSKKEQIISLPKILDDRGNLSFFENYKEIPFEIKRTYLIKNIQYGKSIGKYALIKSQEFIIALSGSFDVVLNDGEEEFKYNLNNSYQGLYVPNMLWRSLDNFSANSLILITSSLAYDANDYIRDYIDFKKIKNEKK